MPMFGDHTESRVFPHPHGEWVGPEDAPSTVGPFAGSLAPAAFLPTPEGEYVFLENLRGKRVLIYAWSPFSPCRAELGKLQKLYQSFQKAGLEVLAVAHDAAGPDRAVSLVQEAKGTFTLLVDRDNYLARLYSYKRVPTVLLIDELGVVRYRSVGGFSFDLPEDVRPIERFLSRPLTPNEPWEIHDIRFTLEEMQAEAELVGDSYLDMDIASVLLGLNRPAEAIAYYERAIAGDHPWPWAATYGIGVALYQLGDRSGAVKRWASALRDAPDNELIRLQLWAELYPDKFFPEIDQAWQQEQRERERRQGIIAAHPALAR